MISQATSAAVQTAYASNTNDTKTAKVATQASSQKGEMSKVDQLQEAISSGAYKVNIEALSQKMAEDLLS